MSSITSYKTTAFKESQKFLVIDPSTQSPSLVLGSDLVDYLRPSLNSVDVETTTDAAVNADYDVGKVIQTTGGSSPGDGNPGLFLVVAAGTGGTPMLNGNELLVLEGANTALGISYDNTASGYSATNVQEAIDNFAVNTAGNGSDLIAHTGTSDTVTEALDKRTIFVGSVAELEALSLPVGTNVYLTQEGRAGDFVVKSGTPPTDPEKGINIVLSNGNYAQRILSGTTGNSVLNVRWFGAVKDGVTDDAPTIQAAIDYLDTTGEIFTGGTVKIPRGNYAVGSTIIVRAGSSANLASITLSGSGMQNTRIKALPGFTGTAVIEVNDGTYCKFDNFEVNGNNAIDYGLHLKGPDSGQPVYSEVRFDNVFGQNAALANFYMERGFAITMNQCRAKGGVAGFQFKGYHTSTNVNNCYALDCAVGYEIDDMSYSVFNACASDSHSQYGYRISKAQATVFNGCGAESCGRTAFLVIASQSLDDEAGSILNGTDIELNGCFSVNCDTSSSGEGASIRTSQADTSSLKVVANNFVENSTASGLSVTNGGVALDHRLILNNCDFRSSVTSFAVENTSNQTTRKSSVSVTAANTPICDLSNLFGTTNQYSGLVHVIAANAQPNGGVANTAGYVLLVTKSTGGSGVVEIASNGLTTGGSSTHPSFTWTLDTTNNQLEASPVGSTSGTFFFYITSTGMMNIT